MHHIQRRTNKILNKLGVFVELHNIEQNVDIHWHEFYELEYVVSGKGKVFINDKLYELKPNTLLFLSPVDFEKIEVETPISIINLAFMGSNISPEIISALPYGCAIYDYPQDFFNLILKEAEINDRWFLKKYTELLNCILIDVVRKCSNTTETIEISPILKAINYMDLNFKNQITLEQISNYVGFTPTYFSAVFKDKINVTFKQYLTSLRLDYAAKLLILSDLSTTEICYASGFNDFSAFARAFKKFFNLSPSQYKKVNTKSANNP